MYTLTLMEPLATFALTVVGAFVGAYFGAYLKKKGENLATHEDIDKLVQQVAAVTTTTKRIEAEITGEVWDRQKRWELKREVLFEATRRLAEVDDSLLAYASALQLEDNKQVQEDRSWVEGKLELLERWSKSSTAFDETKLFVDVVCVKETKDAIDDLWSVLHRIGTRIGKEAGIYRKMKPEFALKLLTVRNAIRKELGIDPLERQSSPTVPESEPR
jgi:hypothetical protein